MPRDDRNDEPESRHNPLYEFGTKYILIAAATGLCTVTVALLFQLPIYTVAVMGLIAVGIVVAGRIVWEFQNGKYVAYNALESLRDLIRSNVPIILVISAAIWTVGLMSLTIISNIVTWPAGIAIGVGTPSAVAALTFRKKLKLPDTFRKKAKTMTDNRESRPAHDQPAQDQPAQDQQTAPSPAPHEAHVEPLPEPKRPDDYDERLHWRSWVYASLPAVLISLGIVALLVSLVGLEYIGSGWLLLMLPIVALTWVLSYRSYWIWKNCPLRCSPLDGRLRLVQAQCRWLLVRGSEDDVYPLGQGDTVLDSPKRTWGEFFFFHHSQTLFLRGANKEDIKLRQPYVFHLSRLIEIDRYRRELETVAVSQQHQANEYLREIAESLRQQRAVGQ